MDEAYPTVDGATLGQKAVGCARKKAEKAQGSKPVSSAPLWPLPSPASNFLPYRDLKVEAKQTLSSACWFW